MRRIVFAAAVVLAGCGGDMDSRTVANGPFGGYRLDEIRHKGKVYLVARYGGAHITKLDEWSDPEAK